jgi:PAS domain S-box-containing protein
MKLSTRLTVAMIALVLLTATAVGLLINYTFQVRALPRALDRLDAHAHFLALELEASVRQARTDVLTQGRGVEGLVQAHIAGGTNPLDGTSEQVWRERLLSRFMAELHAKPSYARFRLTGGTDPGRELVSVDRFGPGGSIRAVPDQELQTLSDRDYFTAAIALPAGESIAAPISLARENGALESPHVPILTVAAPVHAPDGKPFGVMAINVDMRPALAAIHAAATDDEKFYLVSATGDYLVHPDGTKEFGWELGHPERVQDRFPEFADLLRQDSTDPRVLTDRTGARFGIGWETVQLAAGPRVSLIEAVPYSRILVSATAVPSVLGALLVLLGAVPLAVVLARSLSRPLAQITQAVEGFSRNEAIAVPTDAKGEIGVLARTFSRMAADVREKTRSLEHEIEERTRAEGEIREYAAREQQSEQMARAIIDTALDAFLQLDESGTVIGWSPKSEELFGWKSHEIVGGKLDQFIIFPEHRAGYAQRIAAFLDAAQHGVTGRRYESISMRRDGARLNTEVSLTALRRDNGYIINVFVRDVTARIAADEQLRQAQKMEAIGQLTGGIAHDFNNMLAVITGTIDLLAEAVRDRPEPLSITRLISEAADRGAELTAHLLAFARKQPLHPREIEVNGLIAESEKLLRRTLGEHVEIELRLQENAWPALIDPTQLTTALVNLAVNARDAMPDGGKLTLETKNVVLDHTYAQTNPDVGPGDYVMIAVSDTGAGIPEAIRSRVFEPFFTTKEIGRGTGLGLSMVYGFVKQSGGHVKAYSEEGHGTTFKLYLPRASARADDGSEATDDGSIEGGSETILIVEDDALVRNSVIVQIESLGYKTLAAGNAAEALAFTDRGASFDLLFTDLVMPGKINGRKLAEEIARRRPALKVLFTSGYSENAIIHHGRLDPGVLFLAKPYHKADLARALRAALKAASFSPGKN